jgi:DNA-binding CsgD family transcriptional regulator
MSGRPRVELDVAAMIRQYCAERLDLRQVAALHGVSHETVRRHLLDQGVRLRDWKRQEPAQVDEAEVLNLHAEGMAVVDIAALLGVSAQTIYRRLGGNY